MSDEGKVIIQLGSKVYTLIIQDFEDLNVDVEQCLKTDIYAVVAEMITFPVFFNRIANIKAQMDEFLRQCQFDVKVFEAQLYEEHKKFLLSKGEKATEASIDMAIKRDNRYHVKMKDLFNVQKQADILDGLYWAAKSKDTKLNAISAKIKPEEFEKEILVDSLNGVMVKKQEATFKTTKR